MNLKSIFGKKYNDPLVEEYKNRYVNKLIADKERNMPIFIHNETVQLSVEELIAYQFQNAREQASVTAGENVKDVVITVSITYAFLSGTYTFYFQGYTIRKPI